MAKKNSKTNKTKKPQKYDPSYILSHPSTWIAVILTLALLVVSGLSLYGLQHSATTNTALEDAELNAFGHLAKMYIKDMDFEVNDQPVIKQATGYGISNEDDALYITFDFTSPSNGEAMVTGSDDSGFRHAILYFEPDSERGTFGHAFGYYDDASYHPEGIYVKLDPHNDF